MNKIDQTVDRFFAAIRDFDMPGCVAVFAENAEITDPVGSPTVRGHAAVSEHLKQMTGAFSKIDLRADKCFVCGQKAAAFFKGTGVGKNGATVTLEGIDVMEFNEAGKITRLSGFWNPAPALAAVTKR